MWSIRENVMMLWSRYFCHVLVETIDVLCAVSSYSDSELLSGVF